MSGISGWYDSYEKRFVGEQEPLVKKDIQLYTAENFIIVEN